MSSAPPPWETIFESMPQALAFLRLIRDEAGIPCDLDISAANQAFRTIFGLPDQVRGRLTLVDPTCREREPDIVALVARVAAAPAGEPAEIYHPAIDRWFDVGAAATTGDLLLSYAADSTDRRRAQAVAQRLQYALDQIDDYPTWTDATGRIVEVSNSACRQLGYSREELLDMTIFDLCPDVDAERWRESWREDAPQTAFRLEVHQRAKNGRVFPVELTINPLVFEGHHYHCTFCRDISERRRLEESLRVTQLSVENAPDMIHWLDRESNITYANRSTCEFLGYSLEELQGMPIWQVSPGLTPEILRSRWGEVTKNGTCLSEDTWRTKDGRLLDVEISACHVSQDGKELGLAFVRDVTERRLAEQSLRESEERYRQLFDAQSKTLKALKERDEQLLQSQKMEAIGRLAGGMAHDFNNVLTTILGYSDLLLASPECDSASLMQDISEIKCAAERGSALTHRILAFSRRQPLKPALMSLNTIVRNTERMLERTMGADVELRTALSPDLAQVEVDEHQFVQVLVNISMNARDAMPKGGVLSIATANAQLDDGFCETHPEVRPGAYVMLSLEDTGVGMEPDVVSHVFEPFYTTKPAGHGTGLGLATAYGVVANSGGFIYVHSQPGRGSTFTLYLPQAGVHSPPPGPSPIGEACPRSDHLEKPFTADELVGRVGTCLSGESPVDESPGRTRATL